MAGRPGFPSHVTVPLLSSKYGVLRLCCFLVGLMKKSPYFLRILDFFQVKFRPPPPFPSTYFFSFIHLLFITLCFGEGERGLDRWWVNTNKEIGTREGEGGGKKELGKLDSIFVYGDVYIYGYLQNFLLIVMIAMLRSI